MFIVRTLHVLLQPANLLLVGGGGGGGFEGVIDTGPKKKKM